MAARRTESKRLAKERSLTYSPLRSDVIEEERLRRQVDADEKLKRTSPDVWQRMEERRRKVNDQTAAINRRLTALNLEPLWLLPSLGNRRQQLKRLERKNMAAIASLRRESRTTSGEGIGTTMPSVRARRSARKAG